MGVSGSMLLILFTEFVDGRLVYAVFFLTRGGGVLKEFGK